MNKNYLERVYDNVRENYLDAKLNYVCGVLQKKGYSFKKLYILNLSTIYEDYLDCPEEFLQFSNLEYFPCIPKGFELTHVGGVQCTLLLYVYKEGLSYKRLMNQREKNASALLDWALKLPKKSIRKGGE